MSQHALTTYEQKQLALLHTQAMAGDGASKPFAREILLLETHIAGTMHGTAKRVESALNSATCHATATRSRPG